MVAAKRFYRAETQFGRATEGEANPEELQSQYHREIMAELSAMKAMMNLAPSSYPDTSELSEKVARELREEIGEVIKLKGELDAISEAIYNTKTEIAALHSKAGSHSLHKTRVTCELDAVISGTEGATEQILQSAEEIDEAAHTLSGLVPEEHIGLTTDIQEKVISIFEACNFQDLTGQRISKVVSTLSFVEERIERMMEIWGGMDSFKDIVVDSDEEPKTEAQSLLHGPSLKTDTDTVSQDDIDALFA
ncbi:hypothetical protein E1162_15160 [Rhodobacteraceae bacterium RKSG542]|uniref:protein phosphatase CheZ n=1 Tax=Pseudovibrio flavus TaxID=2529854 RepID=UPI0012BC9066|nr:protein phosphatase CheZ [Pseudovibrio flavus]MTI18582.1 hypothetical protein [Pseudovibrio flavus]